MTWGNTRRPSADSSWYGALAALALGGCAVELADSAPATEAAAIGQELVFIPNTPRLSVSQPVEVCYYAGAEHTGYVNWVQSALNTTWGNRSALEFTGPSTCGFERPPNSIAISLLTSSVDSVTLEETPITNENDIGGNCEPWTGFCRLNVCDPDVPSTACGNVKELLQHTAVHEVGHALGFLHEHQRPDSVTVCPPGNQNDGNFVITQGWELTPFDQNSIMSYCRDANGNFVPDRTPMDYTQPGVNLVALSAGDIDGIQAAYGFDSTFSIGRMCDAGDQLYLEDLNADGLTDFLCRGTSRIYATINGTVTGTWSTFSRNTTFCRAAGESLRVGDFNGDQRADLMCRSASAVRIDYAAASVASLYGGEEWSMGGWCPEGSAAALYLGDFNRDTRTDVLCLDWANDYWFIDYADASGHFGGGFGDALEAFGAAGSCLAGNQTPANVLVADVNGDRRDDLICDGLFEWQVYTTNSQHRIVTASSRTKSYWLDGLSVLCLLGNAQAGRLDGDARADLLCRRTVNSTTASISIQFGKGMLAGALGESDWTGPVGGFCAAATSKLRLMKYDNNARADFVCENADGTITIALTPSTFG